MNGKGINDSEVQTASPGNAVAIVNKQGSPELHTELKNKYRFWFLSVVVFLEFGRYYCQELPSALQDPLMKVKT